MVELSEYGKNFMREHVGIKSAPERIYLVREDDCNYAHDDTNSTWCSDRINKEDIEYVRADLCKIKQ